MITAVAATQLDSDNPWPGLESFEEGSYPFFFGRAREAEALRHHVVDSPVTVLYGRSGLGKTSLLRAGVFPLLRQDNFLPIYVRFTVKSDGAPLTRQLHQCVRDAIRAEVPDAVLPGDDESLWEYLHRTDFELWSAQNYPLTPVIVLDQFEELFTHGERVPELVRAFRDGFGDLAENRIPADLAARISLDKVVAERFNLRSRNYKIMVSLREDFLPSLEGWCGLIPSLGRSRVRLLRLRTDAALDAVLKPAGHLMSEELAQQVVGIVAGADLRPEDASATPNGAVDVEPPLLSLFCRELNEERKRRGLTQMDARLVEDARHSTLPNYYAKSVAGMRPNVARFVESKLISEKGFRAAYAIDDAVPAHLTENELDRLIRARLVRIEDRYGAQWIELTHDVLTDTVREHRDRRRADEERAELAERAAELDRERLAERERRLQSERTTRRFRWMTVAMALVSVAAVVMAVVAIKARDVAGDRFRDATAQWSLSEPQLMLAGQSSNRTVEPLVIQLALAGHAIPSGFHDNTYELQTVLNQERDLLKIIDMPYQIWDVAFSPDGHLIASGGGSDAVQLWDTDTGQSVGPPLRGHQGFVQSVAFGPNGDLVASGGNDGTVRLWDVGSGRPVGGPLRGHDGAVTSVAFSRDNHTLASGGADGTVRIWDSVSGRPVGGPLRGHDGSVISVAFSPDRRTVASGGADGSVRLWDAQTGQPVAPPMHGHDNQVNSVAFNPDGRLLVSAGDDAKVRLWDAGNGAPVRQTTITGVPIWSVAFSRDGMRIAGGGGDRTIRLLDTATLDAVGVLTGHEAAVQAVAFSTDDRRLVSGSDDGSIRVWDSLTWQPVTGTGETTTFAEFSPDGSKILSGGKGNLVQAWDPAMGRRIGSAVEVPGDGVEAVYPLGDSLVASIEVVDGSRALRIRDSRTLQQVGQLVRLPDDWWSAWTDRGDALAVRTGPGTIQLIGTADGQGIGRPVPIDQHSRLTQMGFSPAGDVLATGTNDGIVQLWDSRTGEPVGGPMQGPDVVTALGLSVDGRRLAVGYRDYTLRLWDTGDSRLIGDWMALQSILTAVTFSPDGRIVAAGDADGTVTQWGTEHQVMLSAPLRGHNRAVSNLEYSSDGSKLLSASEDHTFRLWPVPVPSVDATRDALCSKLTHNMSVESWNSRLPGIDYTEACPGLPQTDFSEPTG